MFCCVCSRWRKHRRRRRQQQQQQEQQQQQQLSIDGALIDLELRLRLHISGATGDIDLNTITANPITVGLPPPAYQEHSYIQSISSNEHVTELPPPYVSQAPTNDGPASVLPSYNEATSDSEAEGHGNNVKETP